MRVQSQKIQQAIFVVGEPLDEGYVPNSLALYNADGTPMDLTQDATKMRWMGEWDAETIYAENDVVSYEDALWIAPMAIPTGVVPGWVPTDGDVLNFEGYMIKESDRFNSEDPIPFKIGPPPGRRIAMPFTAGYTELLYLDKTGVTTGLMLTVTPVSHAGGSAALTVRRSGAVSWGYQPSGSGSFDSSEVDAHTPKSFSMGDDNEDKVVSIYYTSGVDGEFTAELSSSANLVAPPDFDAIPMWELMLDVGEGVIGPAGPAGPAGADGAPGAAGAAGATGPAGPGVPAGGTTGKLLAKKTATDYDTEWVTPPSGGAPAGLHVETFDTDLSAWTYAVGSAANWTVAGGLLTPQAAGVDKVILRTGLSPKESVQLVKYKHLATGASDQVSIAARWIDANNWIGAIMHDTGMHIYTIDAGAAVQRAIQAIATVVGKWYWVRFSVTDDISRVEWFTNDPRLRSSPSPAFSIEWVISVAKFQGITGGLGIRSLAHQTRAVDYWQAIDLSYGVELN